MHAELERYRQQHASPDAVFAWLRDEYPLALDRRRLGERDEWRKMERDLLSRDSPLINFGLALYSPFPHTASQLYASGDVPLEIAVLSGRSISDRYDESWLPKPPFLKHLVEERKMSHLAALLRNPVLPDEILISLFEKTEAFESLEYEEWLELLHIAAEHERLTRPPEPERDDSWSDLPYNLVFSACWNLSMTLKTDRKSAYALLVLTQNLVPEEPVDFNVWEAIARWRWAESDREPSTFPFCRRHLARLIPDYSEDFALLRESSDPSLREAYYERFRPDSIDEIYQLHGRDGAIFLDGAVHNPHFYRNPDFFDVLNLSCVSSEHVMYLENGKARFGYTPRHDAPSMVETVTPDTSRIESKLEDLMAGIDIMRDQVAAIHQMSPNIESRQGALGEKLRNLADQAQQIEKDLATTTASSSRSEGGDTKSVSNWLKCQWLAWGIFVGLAIEFIFFSSPQ